MNKQMSNKMDVILNGDQGYRDKGSREVEHSGHVKLGAVLTRSLR